MGTVWHAAFVRSTVARGRIAGIDTDGVNGVAGASAVGTALDDRADAGCHVLDGQVFTGADFWGVSMPGINPLMPLTDDAKALCTPVMAVTAVNGVGAVVAVVLARSSAAARRRAEAVVVRYEDVDVDVDAAASSASGRVLIAEQTWTHGCAEPVLTPGALRVSVSHEQPRVAPFALEPRAMRAQWDAAAQSLTVHLGTQTPSRTQDNIARALGLDAAQVRVVSQDVGGAYGAKSSVHPEELIVAVLAKRLAACVVWQATRSEEFLSGTQGRGGRLAGALTVSRDGKLLALDARADFEVGAWLPYSTVVPALNAMRVLPGPYAWSSEVAPAQVSLRAAVWQTDTPAVNIYRGAGRPEAVVLMERLMDEAAKGLGADPLAFRLRHLLPPEALPHTTVAGQVLDSGNYPALALRCAELFGYAARREQQEHGREHGQEPQQSLLLKEELKINTEYAERQVLIGLGIACYVEPCGTGWEAASVVLHADGRVEVFSGSADQGQGHATSFAQIAAQALGCAMEQVTVHEGDTALCPSGIGALASRSMAIGGSAVLQAAREVAREAAREETARRDALQSSAAQAVQGAGDQPSTQTARYPIRADVRYTAPMEAWAAGCVMVQVRIDVETGVVTLDDIVMVDDAGQIVSPLLAHGQLLGGAAQGVGQALMERVVFDVAQQVLTGSLMDYAIPRATDMPRVQIDSLPSPSPANLLGAKGVGEAGTIGVPAAILNAVCDALARYRANIDTTALCFPLSSEKIWNLLQTATHNHPSYDPS